MLSRTTHLRYLPRVMHAAYMAKDKGVVGRVNWQFLPRALKSFTGHYKERPVAGYPRPPIGPGGPLLVRQGDVALHKE